MILVEPAFEESIGFVARAMKNFGLTALHLVNPAAILGDNGRMRGGHAQDVLDSMIVHDSLPDALNGLDLSVGSTAQRAHTATNLLRKPMSPRELGQVLSSQAGTVGIVIGREDTGLTNHELSLCDALVTIPASSAYPTLNLSHAAAIIFYELHNSGSIVVGDELAVEQVRTSILNYLARCLSVVGLEEYKIGLTIRALKNVMGRSAIRKREGSLVAGAFRQISQALPNTNRVDRPLSEVGPVKLSLKE